MNTYKVLAAGLAVASLLTASVASAQTATTTTTIGGGGPDLAVSINGTGIMLDATHSSQSITVSGLPFSISGAVGGTCMLMNNGTSLGTIGTANTNNSLEFATGNSVTVPAGSSVTLTVNCVNSTPGTYPVSLATSLIPAKIANGSQSITPRGIGGASNTDTTAVGTLTINSTGSVGGISGGTTGNTGGGAVLGTSTGSSLPGGTTSGTGSSGTPGVPNTGDGGAMATNLVILAAAALLATGGVYALRRTGLAR